MGGHLTINEFLGQQSQAKGFRSSREIPVRHCTWPSTDRTKTALFKVWNVSKKIRKAVSAVTF